MKLLILLFLISGCGLLTETRTVYVKPKVSILSSRIDICINKLIDKNVKPSQAYKICVGTYRNRR